MFSLRGGICAGISRLLASDTGLMMSSVHLPGDGVLMMFKLTPEPPDMERCQDSTVKNQRKVSQPTGTGVRMRYTPSLTNDKFNVNVMKRTKTSGLESFQFLE